MKLKLSTYYLTVLALMTTYVCYIDPELGWRYLAFWLLNIVALYFARSSYKIVLLMFLGTIFLSYYLRGFVVSMNYDMFTFIHVYDVDRSKILMSYDLALAGTTAFTFGFIMLSFKYTHLKRKYLNSSKSQLFLKNFWMFVLVLIVLIAVKVLLVQFASVGRRGLANETELGFMTKLIPLDLPFVIVGIMLFKYKEEFKGSRKWLIISLLLALCYSVFITGSKTFVMIFALCYIVYLLYSQVKIKVGQFAMLILLGVSITAYSFAISRAVKASFFIPNLTTAQVFQLGFEMMKDQEVAVIFDEITGRFNGFDGQLKYLSMQGPKYTQNIERLEEVFSLKEIGLHVAEALLPKVELTKTRTCGKAVGIFAEKADPIKAYAGALGLIAASCLIDKEYYLLVLFLMGMCVAFLVKLVNYIKDADLQFCYFFFVCYFVMNLAMSGNFDVLISDLIIKSVVALFIVFAVSAMANSIRSNTQTVQLA